MRSVPQGLSDLRSCHLVAAIALILIVAAVMRGGWGRRETELAQWEALNEEAVAAYRAGNYAAGVAPAEAALDLARSVFGDRTPYTLQSLNSLAGLYERQGRYDEAEPLFAQALELGREALGPAHPDTLQSLKSLAVLYERLGRRDEAEGLRAQFPESGRQRGVY